MTLDVLKWRQGEGELGRELLAVLSQALLPVQRELGALGKDLEAGVLIGGGLGIPTVYSPKAIKTYDF